LLTNLFEKSSPKEEIQISLKYGHSQEVFDKVMKLLFGFKEVIVTEQELIQLFIICTELGINEADFMKGLEKSLVERLSKLNTLEAYDMCMKLNKPAIKDLCLEVLATNNFKDLMYQEDTLKQLDEKSFVELMEYHHRIKKEGNKPNQLLTVSELSRVITKYCVKNFEDEKLRSQKKQSYLRLFLCVGENENIENFEQAYDEVSSNDENLSMATFKLLQAHLLKIEKQNKLILEENQTLKIEMRTMNERPDSERQRNMVPSESNNNTEEILQIKSMMTSLLGKYALLEQKFVVQSELLQNLSTNNQMALTTIKEKVSFVENQTNQWNTSMNALQQSSTQQIHLVQDLASKVQKVQPIPSNCGKGRDNIYYCKGSCSNSPVWGTDIYTSDSHYCSAARHSGAVSNTGNFYQVDTLPGQIAYTGSTRNDVATISYGNYGASIKFTRAII